jgi:hypothetical protein
MGMQANTNEADRVRANTSPKALKNIERTMQEKVLYYSTQPREVITRRIGELDREWDIERILEANASSLALLGILLGLTKGKRYFMLSAGVLGFLLSHAIQGWCPPVPALRALGVRTRAEIDREKYALKVLRGDFQEVATPPPSLKENPVADVMQAVKEN